MGKGNILIGRDGSAIGGELLDKEFTIRTLLGCWRDATRATRVIPFGRIHSIVLSGNLQ